MAFLINNTPKPIAELHIVGSAIFNGDMIKPHKILLIRIGMIIGIGQIDGNRNLFRGFTIHETSWDSLKTPASYHSQTQQGKREMYVCLLQMESIARRASPQPSGESKTLDQALLLQLRQVPGAGQGQGPIQGVLGLR
jgi:hypothetical protein